MNNYPGNMQKRTATVTHIQRAIDQRKRVDVARAELTRMTVDEKALPEVLEEAILKYTKDGTLSHGDPVVDAAQMRMKEIETRNAIDMVWPPKTSHPITID